MTSRGGRCGGETENEVENVLMGCSEILRPSLGCTIRSLQRLTIAPKTVDGNITSSLLPAIARHPCSILEARCFVRRIRGSIRCTSCCRGRRISC